MLVLNIQDVEVSNVASDVNTIELPQRLFHDFAFKSIDAESTKERRERGDCYGFLLKMQDA